MPSQNPGFHTLSMEEDKQYDSSRMKFNNFMAPLESKKQLSISEDMNFEKEDAHIGTQNNIFFGKPFENTNENVEMNAISFNNSSSATFLNNDDFGDINKIIENSEKLKSKKDLKFNSDLSDINEENSAVKHMDNLFNKLDALSPVVPKQTDLHKEGAGPRKAQTNSRNYNLFYEDEEQQLIQMKNTFENILESKEKQVQKNLASVKVIQNSANDKQVKIPMLNLGRIVENQSKEYYDQQGFDLDSISVTDDFVIDATGTYTSPLDAINEDLKLQNEDDSFNNETTAPLNQD